MLDLPITVHAGERIRQRGFRDDDINLLLQLAEPCGPDRYRLNDSAARCEISRLKRQIQAIERMKGSMVIVCDGKLVTVHHGQKRIAHARRRGKGGSHEC